MVTGGGGKHYSSLASCPSTPDVSDACKHFSKSDPSEVQSKSKIKLTPILPPSHLADIKDKIDSIVLCSGVASTLSHMRATCLKYGLDEAQIDMRFVFLHYLQPRITFMQNFASIYKDALTSAHKDAAIAELGVYKGDFACLLNASFPATPLYLFDTFAGFDARDIKVEKELSRATYATPGLFNDTSVNLVLSKMPFPKNCVVKKGFFPDTARGLEDIRYIFVSLDTDLYAPILEGLRYFYPRLVSGGCIVVHDYFSNNAYAEVRGAVERFASEASARYYPLGDDISVVFYKG